VAAQNEWSRGEGGAWSRIEDAPVNLVDGVMGAEGEARGECEERSDPQEDCMA